MRTALWTFLAAAAFSSCSHPHATPNWQNLDLEKDGVPGISTGKAYSQLLGDKKAETTIVAVLDSGIDTTQEDLRPVLWTDSADGSHGRNYILQERGKEDFIPMLGIGSESPGYQRTLNDYNLHVTRLSDFIRQLKASKWILERIRVNIGKQEPSLADLGNYQPRNEDETRLIGLVLDRMPAYSDFDSFRFAEVDHLLELGQYHLEHALNRAPELGIDSVFSNKDVSNAPLGLVSDPNAAPEHGTYMASIIAAVRNNGIGIDGIAGHTRIMSLKLFDNIREMRNDNLAAAIRYAAGHGARVISMSFGKTFSWHREVVDSAVRYAMSKGVLLVHSAGNDGMDLDADGNAFFPSPQYQNGGVAPAWITVGASGFRDDTTLVPKFSNYGHKQVDVFAPGVQITGVRPHSGLTTFDGTSQAGAVVAGLAALIMAYYPALTAVQVREIIMRSVVKRSALEDKCISGGIVNAYNALQLAAVYRSLPDQHNGARF